ncbi:MAG: hypothetical protein MRZ75_07795 [Roseburia sp.]|uniref:hypothetical protein n=1 Tax=Roseburia sp. 831b TaxID=1261635 RepID=UPI00117A30F4|nr:hypothetical protein [Roseburia sp. 831b]MCI5919205.1 hypothetical protein [Roseburia sp.]MDY5884190.1 hypothetical protein [Roseburia sp.]WVK74521.1 hypothetical protein BIV16_15695 [Roseburia sp. 831b]
MKKVLFLHYILCKKRGRFFDISPDYFSNVVREEYGAIFGVSLGEEYLEQIEKLRIDREEIEKIALLGEISSDEEIRELDRKLTEFY